MTGETFSGHPGENWGAGSEAHALSAFRKEATSLEDSKTRAGQTWWDVLTDLDSRRKGMSSGPPPPALGLPSPPGPLLLSLGDITMR